MRTRIFIGFLPGSFSGGECSSSSGSRGAHAEKFHSSKFPWESFELLTPSAEWQSLFGFRERQIARGNQYSFRAGCLVEGKENPQNETLKACASRINKDIQSA